MRIYISIPISGTDVKVTSLLANMFAERLRLRGHEPLNPFSVPTAPESMAEKDAYAYYMGEDMKMLLTADAIFMVDRRWNKSKGCSIEHHAACVMGLEMFYSLNDIPDENQR